MRWSVWLGCLERASNKTDIIKSSSILSENINEIIMISFGTNCIIIKKRDDKVNKEFNRVNYKFKNFL